MLVYTVQSVAELAAAELHGVKGEVQLSGSVFHWDEVCTNWDEVCTNWDGVMLNYMGSSPL